MNVYTHIHISLSLSLSIFLSIYLLACVCIYTYLPKSFYHLQDATQSQFFYAKLPNLNSEFSFSLIGCHTKFEKPILSYYLPIAGGRTVGFRPFPKVYEMKTISFRI